MNEVVVVANFSNTDFESYRIGVPVDGDWVEAVNSQDSAYMGDGATNPGTLTSEAIASDGYSQSLEIALAGMALVILTPADGSGIDDPDSKASDFRLYPPAPNPTAAGLHIAFDLAEPGRARLAIHDVAGRLVRVVGDSSYPAGRSEVSWDGTNHRGERVAAGLYVVRIEAGGKKAVRKAIILR
jgi:hypothetical protein